MKKCNGLLPHLSFMASEDRPCRNTREPHLRGKTDCMSNHVTNGTRRAHQTHRIYLILEKMT